MEAIQKRSGDIMKAVSERRPFNPMPAYAPVAALKLNYVVDDEYGSYERQLTKSQQDAANALLKDADLQEQLSAAEQKLSEKYDPLIGEGRPNPLEEYCNAVNAERSKYLKATNTELQMKQRLAIEQERKFINNQVYYAQYTNWHEEFELIKVQMKIRWINIIKNQIVRFKPKGPFCTDKADKKEPSNKLSEFDDVACQYHSSIDLGVWEFSSDCRYFTGKLKLGKLNYTRKIDSDDHDRLVAATLEIKAGAKAGLEKGPVQAQIKAEINAMLEWNDKEITNWEISSEVNVKAGAKLGNESKSIDIAGAKATIGMNSSGRVQGNGLLQNLSLTGK